MENRNITKDHPRFLFIQVLFFFLASLLFLSVPFFWPVKLLVWEWWYLWSGGFSLGTGWNWTLSRYIKEL